MGFAFESTPRNEFSLVKVNSFGICAFQWSSPLGTQSSFSNRLNCNTVMATFSQIDK